MSPHAIACPQCHAALRSTRPLPENKKVRCPQCGGSFTTPAAVVVPSIPPPLPVAPAVVVRSPSGPRLWLPALVLGLLLLAGVAVTGVLLTQRQPAPPPPAGAEEDSPSADDAKRQADDRRHADEERLAEDRRKLDEERRQIAAEKKRLALDRLLRRAEDALKKKDYADAESAYTEALKLSPDDGAAKAGLTAAKTSRLAVEATAAHQKEEKEKRDAEVARLLGQGKAAMGKKEYAAAVRALTVAKQLAPDDLEVSKALEGAMATADADAVQKKKLTDYQTHLDAGRAALKAERFEEAVREFRAALALVPDDPTAAINLKTAQNRLAAGADLVKRQDAFADLMRRAQAALAAGRPDQAVAPLKEAQQLFPDDPNVKKLLRQARVDADSAAAEYDRLIALGDAAMARQRFEEANRLYQQAAQAMPGDPAAAARATAAAAAANARMAALAAYQRYMTQGALDMENRRYPFAVRNFQEALRLVPGDLGAQQGLADARAALANDARRRVQLDTLYQRGDGALQRLLFAEAIAAYTEVLRIAPDDPRALRGFRQAKYAQAMTQGRLALSANRPQDAERYFEEALQALPGDPTASALLTQSRLRRK